MKRNSFCLCIICPLLCSHFVCTIISFQGSFTYWHLALLWSLHTSMLYATAKHTFCISFICCCSAAQSCHTLCDPMDYSTPGLPVLHHLPELKFAKFIFIALVMPSSHLICWCPLFLLPSILPSFRDFSRVVYSHQMTKILELQLQHQSFQWIFRLDLP